MKRIVVGVTDREQGIDALRLAREVALRSGAEVLAAAVFVFEPTRAPLAYPEAQEAFFESTTTRAAEHLEGVAYHHMGLRDTPARALHAVAEEEDADVIVLGSTHRGKLGRVLPGSVGERLLNGAERPVAIAPLGYRAEKRSNVIGVGYDGLREAELALREAIALASDWDARLRLITAVPPAARWQMMSPELLRHPYERFQRDGLAEARSAVEAEGVLEEGSPGAVLAQNSADLDLLVLGSRAFGPVGNVLLGSTSAEVMRSARCPVLVMPRGAEAEDFEAPERDSVGA